MAISTGGILTYGRKGPVRLVPCHFVISIQSCIATDAKQRPGHETLHSPVSRPSPPPSWSCSDMACFAVSSSPHHQPSIAPCMAKMILRCRRTKLPLKPPADQSAGITSERNKSDITHRHRGEKVGMEMNKVQIARFVWR